MKNLVLLLKRVFDTELDKDEIALSFTVDSIKGTTYFISNKLRIFGVDSNGKVDLFLNFFSIYKNAHIFHQAHL